jgi:hypothetical protein
MATKSYTVIGPLVLAKNEQGGDVYLYQGAPVPDGQSDQWIQNHLDSGLIAADKDATQALSDQAGAGVEAPAKSK